MSQARNFNNSAHKITLDTIRKKIDFPTFTTVTHNYTRPF